MKLRPHAFLAALCLAASAVSAQPAAPAADDPLFAALGGKPGVDAIVDALVPRMFADPKIGGFFVHTVQSDLKKQLADQVCAVAGGPCVYEGAAMKKAHADFAIGKADFNRLVELLQAVMDARGIAFADQNRLLARLAPMHRDVITTH